MAPGHRRAPRTRPARARRAGAPAVLAVLLGGALTACSGGADAGPATAADATRTAVASGADCLAPQVLTALGFDADGYTGTPHPAAPDAGPLPDGFTAVSALLCSTGEVLTDGSGRWAAVTATRLEGDVRPLVDALGSTATAAPATTTPACAADAERADLWLVDALGAAVRVALPGGGCGALPTDVAAGLDALDAVDVEHSPVALVAPRATTAPG